VNGSIFLVILFAAGRLVPGFAKDFIAQ
jgi:hypothetical protein